MTRIIVGLTSRIGPGSLHLGGPGTGKLRTTITARKIASVIEINFNIRRNCIFCPIRITNPFKVHSGPGLSRSIVSVAEFALIFHVPTIGTFCRTLLPQHDLALFFFVWCVV
jgi:hypothetical protein